MLTLNEFVNSLGTFISKFYPYKIFIKSLLTGVLTMWRQLEQNIREKENELIYTADTTHTEVVVPIYKASTSIFPYVGCSTGIEIDQLGYAIPTNVESISGLPDGYTISPAGSAIFEFPADVDTIFATDVITATDRYQTKLGFLYGIQLKPSLELMSMYRYGMTEYRLKRFFNFLSSLPYALEAGTVTSVAGNIFKIGTTEYTIAGHTAKLGKVYQEGDPLTDIVKLYRSTEFVLGDDIWGDNGLWGTQSNWGDCVEIYQPEEYIIETPYTGYIPIKFLKEAAPPWLKFRVNILVEVSDEISVEESYIATNDGIVSEEECSCNDTIQVNDVWGWPGRLWGSGTWDTMTDFEGPFVREFKW